MIVAIAMVRDEQDVIEATIRHLLAEGVDKIVVADNGSTDGTRDILEQLPVTILTDPEPAYYQARKMTALAHHAADEGDWVVPFDADEVFYHRDATLAEALRAVPDRYGSVGVVGWDHIARPDDPDGHPFVSMRYRRSYPQPLPKVIFRYQWGIQITQGNHGVRRHSRPQSTDRFELRHFQYRTYDQYARKVRHGKKAYELTDLGPLEGTHWRLAGALSDRELCESWERLSREDGLVYDPAPLRCSS